MLKFYIKQKYKVTKKWKSKICMLDGGFKGIISLGYGDLYE